MKTAFLATLVAAALATSAASAAPIHATGVKWSGGTVADGKTSSARNDADNALGATDGNFLSIGLGGWAELTFGQSFTGPGTAVEVTWSRQGYLESAKVYGKADGIETYLATLSNQTNGGTSTFGFKGVFTSLVFRDTSSVRSDRDGFDIDSVSVSPVPVPAAGLLLGSALAGGGLLRKLRRKA